MNVKLLTAVAACAMLAAPGLALAQQAVIANADLNVRSGPGDEYPVIDQVALDSELRLLGCMESSEWCQVSYGAAEGWVPSDLLVARSDGVEVLIRERPSEMGVPVVIYEGAPGGPYEPDPRVRTYITENPYDPVYYDGELKVGTVLPESFEIHEIPDHEYRYVYLDDGPVLVEPQTRRIVYIIR